MTSYNRRMAQFNWIVLLIASGVLVPGGLAVLRWCLRPVPADPDRID